MPELAAFDWESLFQRLVACRLQIALVVTGGGSGTVRQCLRRSGASVNFVEAVVPYSRRALQQYLGESPRGAYVSAEVARAMALTARERAERLSDRPDGPCAGIALTAALPTQPPRDAVHAIHVAAVSGQQQQQWETQLSASLTRAQAEAIADEMLYRALEWARDP